MLAGIDRGLAYLIMKRLTYSGFEAVSKKDNSVPIDEKRDGVVVNNYKTLAMQYGGSSDVGSLVAGWLSPLIRKFQDSTVAGCCNVVPT